MASVGGEEGERALERPVLAMRRLPQRMPTTAASGSAMASV